MSFAKTRSVRRMMTPILLLSMTLGFSGAQQHKLSPDLYDYEFAFAAASPELLARRKAIIEESSNASASEWAGRYVADVGELSYRSVMWAPRAGYILYHYSDTPIPLDLSVGRAVIEGDLLRLNADVPIPTLPQPSYRDTFHLIRWGQSHFLVAPADLLQFCYAVNSTAEDEIGRFLRMSETAAEPEGDPSVPPNYSIHLRRPAITVKVFSVESDRIARNEWPPYRVNVTLDSGLERGVVKGMAFWLTDSHRKSRMKLRVRTVDQRSSQADVVSVWEAQNDKSYFPRPGWTFRNRPTKRDRSQLN